MTEDEAREYRKLFDRKKKALSLPDADREKFIEEYNRIASDIKGKFTEYCFYKIGLDVSTESEETLCMFFEMDKIWSMLMELREIGEGERIDKILGGMKSLYESVRG